MKRLSTRYCVVCGTRFTGPIQELYCSDQCKQAARLDRLSWPDYMELRKAEGWHFTTRPVKGNVWLVDIPDFIGGPIWTFRVNARCPLIDLQNQLERRPYMQNVLSSHFKALVSTLPPLLVAEVLAQWRTCDRCGKIVPAHNYIDALNICEDCEAGETWMPPSHELGIKGGLTFHPVPDPIIQQAKADDILLKLVFTKGGPDSLQIGEVLDFMARMEVDGYPITGREDNDFLSDLFMTWRESVG